MFSHLQRKSLPSTHPSSFFSASSFHPLTHVSVHDRQVSPTSSFSADLGLDSLDTVEVVMAMEEEFAVEIPDAEADKITSVSEAVEYLANNANAK